MKDDNVDSLDIFIEGETIDLCVASCDEYILNQWYRWFNKSEITKLSDYGNQEIKGLEFTPQYLSDVTMR